MSDADRLLQEAAALAADLGKLGQTLRELTAYAARIAKSESAADAWVRAHGELISKRGAAKMMGCSEDTIYRLIKAGDILTAPNGAVNVRSCAEYATRKGK